MSFTTMNHQTSLEIETYVFLDTESTGLPTPGNNPRIIEICLLAYSQGELLTNIKHPRVCNKLVLCFDPRRPIGPKTSNITGLHNDALDGLPAFKKQAALLVSFLENLPQPVCVVAHNGYGFDFPLLNAEFKRNNLPEGLSKIHCADSVWAFRNLYGLPALPVKFISNLQTLPPDHANSNPRVPEECVRDPEKFVENCDSPTKETVKSSNEENTSNSHTAETVCANQHKLGAGNGCFADCSAEQNIRKDEVTPEKQHNICIDVSKPRKRNSGFMSDSTENTAKKRLFQSENEMAPPTTETFPGKAETSTKETLSSNGCSAVQKRVPQSFSLPKLYFHYFGQEPQVSHTAEDDCLTLMKVVRLRCKEFFSWCNHNAITFGQIQPMY